MRRLLLMLASVAAAQTLPGPALSVDAGALRHAISPDVYGINFYWDLGEADDPNRLAYLAAAPDVRATVRRWGGSSTSEYSWPCRLFKSAHQLFMLTFSSTVSLP